jgi:hypothetical protein
MRRRRPGRFSRQWQRERAAQADAEADESAMLIFRLARMFGRGPMFPFPRSRGAGDAVRPYRGFRAGRRRWRPDDTGYGEPAAPEASRDDEWHEHPWLAGLREESPVSDAVVDGVGEDDPADDRRR